MTNDFQVELIELKCHKLEMIQLRDVSIQFLEGIFGKEKIYLKLTIKLMLLK